MRLSKEILATLGVVCLTSGVAMANCDANNLQAYAHPSWISLEGHTLLNQATDVTIGSKICKPCNAKTIAGKQNVVIGREAKKLLNDMKSKMDTNRANAYDPKMPVLRSEIAYIVSTGLGLTQSAANKYTDLDAAYWAKDEIDKALAADVMIGYPDSSFKPEQRVTKAEVFCTLAKIFDVDHSLTAAPKFNKKLIKHIPHWAVGATNEVLATGILNAVPDESALINNEYLSKEQVTYLVGALSEYLKKHPAYATAAVKSASAGTDMYIRMDERLNARVSNAGDTFTATLVEPVTIAGDSYSAGAKIKGIVAEVVRPGYKNAGYIKVQFKEISCDGRVTKLPETVLEAVAETQKDPNFVARLLGAPLSVSGRVLGVAGRTIGQECNLAANGVETYGDNLSNTLCDTFCLQPVAGAKNFGRSFVTAGKYIWNTAENAVGGVFGVGYEMVDEVRYLFAPKYSNNSSLNPKEVLKVTFD